MDTLDDFYFLSLNIILWIIIFSGCYILFWLFCLPMNRIRKLDETGWKHLNYGGGKHKQNIWIARKNRKQGNYPAPFPNGWFIIAESREIGKGQIRQVDALGKTFAVFRGESGHIYITEAYCPHLGANLCSGGKVENDCITCPFHSWSFSGLDGSCSKIPYSTQKPPKNSQLKIYQSLEQNGMIYVWNHNKDEPATWWPDVIPEIENGQYIYQGRSEYYVNCHIQEIPENGADGIVCGGEPNPTQADFSTKISNHSWNITWEPLKESHKARIQLNHAMVLFNRFKLFNLNLEAVQIGPASVHLHFQSFMGRGVMVQSVLPVQPMVQKLVHVFYTGVQSINYKKRSWLPPYAKLVLLGESIHVERDIRVWNNKMYVNKPVLVKEDAYITKFRRWYSQFYPAIEVEEKSSDPVVVPNTRDLSW